MAFAQPANQRTKASGQSFDLAMAVLCQAPSLCTACTGKTGADRQKALADFVSQNVSNSDVAALFGKMATAAPTARRAMLAAAVSKSRMSSCAFADEVNAQRTEQTKPKNQVPKTEAPKPTPPKAAVPKAAPSNPGTPKTEAPKPTPPKAAVPKAVPSKPDTPKSATPKEKAPASQPASPTKAEPPPSQPAKKADTKTAGPHPAVAVANGILVAIADQNAPGIRVYFNKTNQRKVTAKRIPGLLKHALKTTGGLRSTDELRAGPKFMGPGAVLAKVRTEGHEVFVLVLTLEDGAYKFEDLNSPSIKRYERQTLIWKK